MTMVIFKELQVPELIEIASEKKVAFYNKIAHELTTKIKLSINTNHDIKIIMDRIKAQASSGVNPTIFITSTKEIRALLLLWIYDDSFLKKVPLTKEYLNAIESVSPQISLLSLFTIIQLYFKSYDYLKKGLPILVDFIKRQLELRNKRIPYSLKNIYKIKDILFNNTATENTVELCIKQEIDMLRFFEKNDIQHDDKDRFYELCQIEYYVKRLNELEIGQENKQFLELYDSAKYNSMIGENRLGNIALKIFIDKCMTSNKEIPDNWRDLILFIAKDPRTDESLSIFRKWWSPLGEKRIFWFKQQLAKLDLNMFLKVFEEFAKTDETMQRMFPDRKEFLLKISKLGIVSYSRLFLGDKAKDFLLTKSNYQQDEIPAFANLDDRHYVVILLKIGNLWMLEGSHNFGVRILNELPENLSLLSYNINLYSMGKIRKINYITNHNKGWEGRVIDYFNDFCGMEIDPADILNKNKYLEYLQKRQV